MKAARLFLTAGVAVFAVAALGNGLDRLSRGAPGMERLVPGPFRAQADRSAAAVALSRNDGHQAEALARAAVRRDPVDPDSVALLGSSLLATGNETGAEAAFRVAARYGWRNVGTQLYWFQAALQSGDYDAAADRADAILRTTPTYPGREALFAALEGDPRGRAALARHLQQRPEWLDSYLDLSPDMADDLVERRLQVLELAASGGFRFDCAALAGPVADLVRVGRYEEGRALWNRSCPKQSVGQGLADTNFAQLAAEQPSPFGWHAFRSGDVQVSFEGDGAARTLVLGNRAPVRHVVLEQQVQIAPGSYTVSIEGSGATDAVSLSWKCGDAGKDLQNSGLVGNGRTIAVSSCLRQVLDLWLAGSANDIRLREVKLLPAGAAGPAR